MPHRLLTGSFHALELRLAADVASLQREDALAPVSILVGSNLLAAYLKARLAAARVRVNLRFMTFPDLVARLGAESGEPARPVLPRLAPSWMLRGLLADELPAVFRAVGALEGFRAALLETLRDIRDGGAEPGDAGRALEGLARRTPDRADALRGLARLFERHQASLAHFAGTDDLFRAAIRSAPAARRALPGARLLVYGLYDATGQQDQLLGALARAVEIRCYVPYVDAERSAFAERFLSLRRAELGVEPEALPEGPAPAGRSELSRRLFGVWREGAPIAADGSVALVSAPGDARAAVEIVREIARAARDGTIAGFHEAAVLVRHPEEDLPPLIEALRLRGIPYFRHGGAPLAERPLGRAVLGLARLGTRGFPRPAVLATVEWLRAALSPEAAAGIDAAEWRRATNGAAFLAGAESWSAGLDARVREAERERERALRGNPEPNPRGSAREPAPLEPEEAERRHRGVCAVREQWRRVRAAATWPARLSWRQWAELVDARLEPLLGDSPDWGRFTEALDELGELDRLAGDAAAGGGEVSREILTALLAEALGGLACPEGRFQQSGVSLMSIPAARGLRFPLVIVPGLDEGRFPARLRQDPLLLDAERRALEGRVRLPLKAERADEERLLFDMAVRSAERRLVLVTSRLDESSDRERIPSVFFLQAASAARGRRTGPAELASGAVPGFRSAPLDRPAPGDGLVAVDAAEVRLRIVARGGAGALAALARLEPQRLAGPRAFEHARWQRSLTAFDGLIRDPDLRAWVLGRSGPAAGPQSASRLEAYTACPYRFFLRDVLRLPAWTDPEPALELDPADRGRTVHRILERFLESLPEKRLEGSAEDLGTRLDALAREHLERSRPAGIPDLLWEIEEESVRRILTRWLAFELEREGRDGLRPRALELGFGTATPGAGPEIVLGSGAARFALRGRIDRIDLSDDLRRARLVDYKTGSLLPSLRKRTRTLLMGGERLQLAIYRAALGAIPGCAAVERAEAEYLHLDAKRETVEPCGFTAAEVDAAVARLPETLAHVAGGLAEGAFFARPAGFVHDDNCAFCDYVRICGKDRVHRAARKAADPAVGRFDRIGAVDGRSPADSR